MRKSVCSEPPGRAFQQVIALEGMPGAGKTTALTQLAPRWPVIGEYTTVDGAPLTQAEHPLPDQDENHQNNWLCKTAQVYDHLNAGAEVVVSDRDWLSSLSYAHSTGDKELLTTRCRWAATHLEAGRLHVADVYLVMHVDPATSLARRQHRLHPEHPWSTTVGVQRLADFYSDPVSVVRGHHPLLATTLNEARIVHVDSHRPLTEVMATVTTHLEQVGK